MNQTISQKHRVTRDYLEDLKSKLEVKKQIKLKKQMAKEMLRNMKRDDYLGNGDSDSSGEQATERLYYKELTRYHEQLITERKRPDKIID